MKKDEFRHSYGNGSIPDVAERAIARDDWDLVDEASWESFPASDPPSFVHWRKAPER